LYIIWYDSLSTKNITFYSSKYKIIILNFLKNIFIMGQFIFKILSPRWNSFQNDRISQINCCMVASLSVYFFIIIFILKMLAPPVFFGACLYVFVSFGFEKPASLPNNVMLVKKRKNKLRFINEWKKKNILILRYWLFSFSWVKIVNFLLRFVTG